MASQGEEAMETEVKVSAAETQSSQTMSTPWHA